MSRAMRPKRNLLLWALAQLGQFVLLLLELAFLGAARSVAAGEFSWKGFFAALFTGWMGLAAVFMGIFATSAPLRGPRELALWVGVMGVMVLAGAAAAIFGRRVGLWECYLACGITLALLWVHLALGWSSLPGMGGGQPPPYTDFVAAIPPGEKIFGSMWDRIVGLGAAGAYLMMILGGSMAYLLFGSEGRFDAGYSFEWRVARQHLAGRAGIVSVTAIVAVLGVALGVAALVAVTAVMSGYQEDVQEKILSTNAHLVIRKYGIDFEEYEQVEKDARRVKAIVASTPFTFNEAMLSDGDLGRGVHLKGVDPETAGTVTSLLHNLCASPVPNDPCPRRLGADGTAEDLARILEPQDGVASALIGSELFRRLDQPIGSAITLTTPIGIAGARGNAPKRMNFRIGGTFTSGMHEFDSRLMYLRLDAAQQLMGLGKSVTGVEFRVDDPENVEVIGPEVLTAVGRYPYNSLDWRELNLGIFTALKLQKIVMFLVLCSIILVGAFNIASTLFMAVVEKSHEIGVLKSVGARDASIMKIFVLEGWIVGAIGTAIGVVLGLLVCVLLSRLDIGIAADVYMVGELEVRVNGLEVVGTALAALIISHLATIYPALKAARQSPVDAMRYE